MANPHFVKAMQGAVKGKGEQIDFETGEIGVHSTPAIVKDVIIVGSSFREGATVGTHRRSVGRRAAMRASVSTSFWMSSRNLNITRARRCGLVAAHAGCAASALAIACSASDLEAKATLAWTSPVLGLNTSPLRPEAPATSLPPMKWPISRITASLGYALALRSRCPL